MRMLRVCMPLLVVCAALTSVAAAPADKSISVDLREADLRQVIDGIMRGAGANYVIADKLEGKVTAFLENMPLEDALKVILGVTGYISEAGEHGYIIRKDPDAKPAAPPAPRGPRLAAPHPAVVEQPAEPEAPQQPAAGQRTVPQQPAAANGAAQAPNQQGAAQMPNPYGWQGAAMAPGWQGQPMPGYGAAGWQGQPMPGYGGTPEMGYYGAPAYPVQPYVAPARPYPAMSYGWGSMGGGFGRMMPMGQSAFTPLGGQWGNSPFTPLGGQGGAFTPLGW